MALNVLSKILQCEPINAELNKCFSLSSAGAFYSQSKLTICPQTNTHNSCSGVVKMTAPENMEAGNLELGDMNLKFKDVSVISNGQLVSVTFPIRYISHMGIPGALVLLCVIIIVTFLKIYL